MADIVAIPARGEVFLDERGSSRAMRLSWHHDGDLVVLSLWRGGVCTGSFRLTRDEVPTLIAALVAGLASPGPTIPSQPTHLAG